MYFYELAHGDEYQFQADQSGSYYTATILQTDMVNRQPMEFAFLGSCHGMTGTDQGTFSYEFRKGQMVDTVTVGFDHMENCPGWEFGYQWQDSLFENMSKGVPIKEAFDMATAQYPTIAPAVVFLGDYSLAVPSPPSKPSRPNGPVNGKTEQLYSYATSSIDPNNDDIYYWFDWGDNTNTGWIGPYESAQILNASHTWINEGSYSIKVKAKDKNNMESPWSDPLSVSMPKSKMSRIPVMRFLERGPRFLPMLLNMLGKVW
jgi:hypothetical protein